jgi:UDP-N-acetyl-2-amino-2-deoxyglucuronate dehydrogenase
MLLPNGNIWETRIQNVDALLTAKVAERTPVADASGSPKVRTEVYYLATVCQVALQPPLVSISPNPEYPICEAIEAAGYFGLNFLAGDQSKLIQKCIGLDRRENDKLAALDLAHEYSAHGTPLFLECLQALECRVERVWDSGDHRSFVGVVVDRRIRAARPEGRPHRFGGSPSAGKRLIKRLLCQSRLYDVVQGLRSKLRPAVSLEEGTRRMLDSPAPGAVANRWKLAPPTPGICLVGCGWWGGVHALALKSLGGRIRRYYASRDLERARQFAGRFAGEDAFSGLEAALKDPRVDAVLLSLPHHLHYEAALAALAAGKHILVEKPLALTMEAGEQLVRGAESAGVRLAVAEQYRLSPLVRQVREVIGRGELGRITLVRAATAGLFQPEQGWKNDRQSMGGGVLLDVGIHYVDILRYWLGEPERVWAAAPTQLNPQLGGEDAIVAVLQFPGGALGQMQISWSAFGSPTTPNLEILGERGVLQLWFARPYLLQTTPLPPEHWTNRLRRKLPWRIERRLGWLFPQVRRRKHHVDSGDLLGSHALIEDFVRAITTDTSPAVSGAEGLNDLRVVLAAYQALQTGVPAIAKCGPDEPA